MPNRRQAGLSTASLAPIAPMIMQLQSTLVNELHERLPEAGFPEVRPPHCQVLSRIGPQGSRLTDLASAARMTKQSMGFLVDHLEACGYLERVPDPRDARVKAILLTEKGRLARQAVADTGARLEAEWETKVGARRLEQLRDALARIIS
jgi:DNA-binding MarR family transcriptional regulator